ncbi:transglycosylase domain-containing protein [Nocardioides marmoribigeumensis]|uniref:Membrane peptidoglycan carboxypeptidase n=1 Tax=Nocardioides marmoribigeumensis TaxID=433649 RepID=A0ABU2BVL0_9ACTN|nr:transglycosylase domain-containing protein [Nocardioides marmoribigeumensis]MDR7362306.1 membrane peptidoglycan carboxypeptidase [Nocardioides marmoribigeumensis]
MSDKTPKRGPEARSTTRTWVKRVFLLLATVFGLGLVLFAFAYATTDIPDPNQGFEAQTTYVYYDDGKSVLGKFAEQNRTTIPLEDVPQHVQDAVIAAEDATFYSNKGIDPKGILRAAFNNAKGGSTQGASTITQQYVKVLYLTQERSFTRKAKEAILSLKIHRQLSKDEILAGYLNTIYFGRGAYGIEAASRAYFGIPAKKLDVRQGAALAAMINNPNNLDPAEGEASRSALESRYTYVIDRMSELGSLPSVKGDPYRLPKFPKRKVENSNGGQRGHILKMVHDDLVKNGFSESEILTGGLRVTTTIDKKVQAAVEAGVPEVAPKLKGLHPAVASVDPRTGALRGIYAGQDYLKSQLNWAVAGGAPGSTFKAFALATALDYGYSLKSTFDGNSPIEVNGTEFSNEGEGLGESYGSAISLLTATEKSVNTAYIDLADSMDNGVSKIKEHAIAMGIPRNAPGLDDTFSIVLGSATVSPIDMANAYGTIADGGKAKKWYVVQKVKTLDGSRPYKHNVRTTAAISEDVAADTSYALQQVAIAGTGQNANVIGRPIAGKTGTATTDGGHVRSSWFVGYTPQLATAVMYVRGNGNQPLDGFLSSFFGADYPARTWAAVMGKALEGEEEIPFPPPANLEQTAEGHEPYTPPPSPTYTPSPTKSPSKSPSSSPTPTDAPSPSGPPSSTPTATPPGGGGGGGATESPAAQKTTTPGQSPAGRSQEPATTRQSGRRRRRAPGRRAAAA